LLLSHLVCSRALLLHTLLHYSCTLFSCLVALLSCLVLVPCYTTFASCCSTPCSSKNLVALLSHRVVSHLAFTPCYAILTPCYSHLPPCHCCPTIARLHAMLRTIFRDLLPAPPPHCCSFSRLATLPCQLVLLFTFLCKWKSLEHH
jgi:hypothetical protein